MGYYVYTRNHFRITPPLTPGMGRLLSRVGKPFDLGWEVSEDGDRIFWRDTSDKYHPDPDELNHLIDTYLRKWGHTLSGEVTWRGDEYEDQGHVSIVNGKAIARLFSEEERS